MSEIIEEVLAKVGRWGKFQISCYCCLGFVVMFSVFSMSYIFTARDIKYRCYIPECENASETTYNPKWLVDFVPYKEKSPRRCLRYALANNTCTNTVVLKNDIVKCDTFVYQRQETTIVHDFNITCAENLWRLTIIGTINVIGEFSCLAYTGFISDRYGRKVAMMMCVLLSTCIGLIRSISPNYMVYVSLEFLDTALGGGMYEAAFILAMEMVGSRERNVGNTILCCFFAFGQAVLGITAWLSPSWRIMLRILYVPGIISLLFFWTVPESIRWLLSVNRKEEAGAVVSRIAKTNKKQIPKEMIDKLILSEEKDEQVLETIKTVSFKDSVKCKPLLFRAIHCSFTFICCTFVYYGLTIHSVAISENIYLSFIFTVIIEIPAYIMYYFVNEKIGRRLMMFFTLILGGISCVAVGFIPEDYYWLKLCTFLFGKFCLTLAYTVLYVYVVEMFPTNSRHSTFSICSMIGRIGCMLAPQVPLLTRVSKLLPLLMFGFLACTSGALSLLFPETLNTRLPDTIDEAVHIGRKVKKSRAKIDKESNVPLRSKILIH